MLLPVVSVQPLCFLAVLIYGGLLQQSTLCLKINRTLETFYYNFVKIALIAIKLDTRNLHMM